MSDKGGKGLDKNGQMMTLGQERTNDDTWNGQMMTLGTDLGNVWEMFGKCLELSYLVNQ